MAFTMRSGSARMPASFEARQQSLGGCAPFKAHSTAISRRASLKVQAAGPPVATDLLADSSTPKAVRKYLTSAGWAEQWVDGVINEMKKRALHTSVPQVEAMVTYLQSLGIPVHGVENMVSICKPVLARSVEQAAAVVGWLQAKGLSGDKLAALLEAHPELLTYEAAEGAEHLVKGPARASLVFQERGGRRFVGVTLWREGAAFANSPGFAPAKP